MCPFCHHEFCADCKETQPFCVHWATCCQCVTTSSADQWYWTEVKVEGKARENARLN